ncbi:hypothetical protein D3C73_1447870 [compost metagenome]
MSHSRRQYRSVERLTQSIQHLAQQFRADLYGKRLAGSHDIAARTDRSQFPERHQQHFIVAKADDFRLQWL